MSLLLDALKRAAEQKAAKSKQQENADGDAPNAELDASTEDARDDSEDSSLPQHRLEDETELDHSELDTRLRRVSGIGDDRTDTGLDVDDYSDSTLLPLSQRLKSGEDETLIFSVDDVAETVNDEGSAASSTAGDEETDLSMLAADPAGGGGIEVEEYDSSQLADDETDLSRLIAEQAEALQPESGADSKRSAEDETDLSRLMAEQTEARLSASGADSSREDADETDLSQLMAEQAAAQGGESADDAHRPLDDETDLSRQAASGDGAAAVDETTAEAAPSAGDETDIRLPGMTEDEDEELPPLDAAETDQSLPFRQTSDGPVDEAGDEESLAGDADSSVGLYGDDDTDAQDDDMSLLLVEREPTQITSPRSPQEALETLQAGAPSAEEMGLVEDTWHRFGSDPSPDGEVKQSRNRSSDSATTLNRASDAATTSIATASANRGGVPLPDPGSTQTYAPDNYDRTLMRLPNDEASKLMAGMKADSDVVMTPDYAKRVFQSKSSAIRLQHAKVYSGIAVAILVAVAVYGYFEYQSEAEIIEANLRPLKSDPLPATARPQTPAAEQDPLFAEAEVNKRALEILQSVDALDEQQNIDQTSGEVVEESAASAAADGNDAPESIVVETPVEQTTQPSVPRAQLAELPRPAETTRIPQPIALSEPAQQAPAKQSLAAGAAPGSATGATPAGSGTRLQIETGERLEQKQVMLREAYDAFKAGNDTLALQRYNQVLQIDPANRNALLARAAINVHNGNSAAAIKDYQDLLLANPKDSLAMASLLAVANVSPVETETQLKLMIRDEPDSPHLNFALANAYAAQKRWQEAQGHYFTALQNNPNDPNYAYNLAVSLEHISQPQAAVSYYRRALENYNKGLATFSRDAVGRRLEKLAKS